MHFVYVPQNVFKTGQTTSLPLFPRLYIYDSTIEGKIGSYQSDFNLEFFTFRTKMFKRRKLIGIKHLSTNASLAFLIFHFKPSG